MKNLANVLTLIRILFAVLLIFTFKNITVFIGCYLICGIADIADGIAARHFNDETRLGEKLDILASFIFWGVTLYVLIFGLGIEFKLCTFIIIGLIIIMRIVNLVIVVKKFDQFSMLNTTANRIAVFLLYIVAGLTVLLGIAPVALTIFAFLTSIFAIIQENYLLIVSKEKEGFLVMKN